MDDSPGPSTQPDEIGLLDILVTLAENIKLLTLGPLLAGLLALAVSFFWPKTFESIAVLQAEPAIASLMTTAAVLDPVAQSLGLRQGATAEEARQSLRSRVHTSVGRNDKLLTLTVSAETPVQAQMTATALLEATYAQSQPRGSQKARLEKQLSEAQTRLKTAQAAAGQLTLLLTSPSRNTSLTTMTQHVEALDMLAGGSAGLLEASAAAQKRIVELEADLEGLTAAQLLQPPTLPEKAISPKKGSTAILAAFATAFMLLIFVFARSGLQSVQDAQSLAKLARAKRALGIGT